jgi:retinitis pigmentosa 9 protein
MPRKMNFNAHKSWHVHSKGNKDRLEKVNQKKDEKDVKARDQRRERERERDLEETLRMAEKFHKANKDMSCNFMYEPPPGMVKEDDEKPEDCIPDAPQNKDARDFLKHAPSKGLWMPLGKEVKVMQCWRCKAFGHRTGDRECPYALSGNLKIESERQKREDPMAAFLSEQNDQELQKLKKQEDKMERLKQLQELLAKAERRHMKKKLKRKIKKKEEKKRNRKKRKKESSSSSSSASSSSESDSESSSGSSSESEIEDDKKKHKKERRKSDEHDKNGKSDDKDRERSRHKDRRSRSKSKSRSRSRERDRDRRDK